MTDERENNVDELEEKKNTDIEIVSGNGKNLDISPVYSHIKMDKKEDSENSDEKQEIVVPKSKDKKSDE